MKYLLTIFTLLISSLCFASLWSLFPAQTPTPPSSLSITSPPGLHIYQRQGAGNTGTATVPISGSVSLSYDTAQYSLTPLSGYGGINRTWTNFFTQTAGNGNFTGNAVAVPGGWYVFCVRTQLSGTTRELNCVSQMGVGEIFLAAGQSMLVNVQPLPNKVSYADELLIGLSTGIFALGNDPQPGSDGTGGSLWPMFMDKLSTYLQMPVAVLTVARGGTFIAQWQPGIALYTTYLIPSIQTLGPNGYRAELWDQGQSDSSPLVYTSQQYADKVINMIAQSRIDTGWNAPWVIAESTWFNGVPNATIEAGQVIAQGYTNCFPGPNEDLLGDSYRQSDQTHFTNKGGITQAQVWVDALKTDFGW